MPFPAAASPAAGYAAPLTEGALAKAPQVAAPALVSSASVAPSIEALRHAVGSALVNAGHNSAAQLLGAATWNLDGANLRIEAPGMGKKMLALTVNPAAEKIIRQELQRLGAPTRFLIVPGDGPTAAPAAMAAPMAGSIQEAALAHPLVQKAKEIFQAEVRSVVDLRLK
jgi:DNA polymerase-3 subunit gamma/tau